MEAEELVQIYRRVRVAGFWLRHRQRRSQRVIVALAVWNNHVQAVDRASLKNCDQSFLASVRGPQALRKHSPLEERRRVLGNAYARESDPA
jgi:hypothetical protein